MTKVALLEDVDSRLTDSVLSILAPVCTIKRPPLVDETCRALFSKFGDVRSSLPLEEIAASHKKSWLDALQSIDDFNPETIFLIGTASLLLSDVLADFDGKRVIVFLPLNEGIEQVKQKNLRSNQIVFVCSSFEENFRANKIFNAYRRIPSALHVLNVTALNLLQNQSNFLREMCLQT
jgi:hypothetical protein